MRDVRFVPLDETYEMVISSDNAANIGQKVQDEIQAPYSLVAQSLFRVAYMENRALGASPLAIIFYNFSDETAWDKCIRTIGQEVYRLGFDVPITGSTESNFPLPQSAFGLSVIGKIEKGKQRQQVTPVDAKFAVIGQPLVGEEVITKKEQIVPLVLFEQMVEHRGVHEVLPVGSKGIGGELNILCKANDYPVDVSLECSLNLQKSGGPSTCFLITYDRREEENIRSLSGRLFHPIALKA